jgi:hypothetical protein
MFYERQKKKAVEKVLKYIKDPGKGRLRFEDSDGKIVKNLPVPHFLLKPELNLFDKIRESALEYFDKNDIKWWKVDTEDRDKKGLYLVEETPQNMPTRNLLSSQVSCLNHLFILRENENLANAVLKKIAVLFEIDDSIQAVKIDTGFVEFEVMEGKKIRNPLEEKESHYDKNRKKYLQRKRGEFSTSVDAVMIGRTKEKNILFLFEWKYTELYSLGKIIRTSNSEKYNELLRDEKCPIRIDNFEKLYYEPYYQLMRQTLLGWKMVDAKEYDCTDYIHLHIIPSDHEKLRSTITSPGLVGTDMTSAWKNVLANPNKYMVLSPDELFETLEHEKDLQSLIKYLKLRYWE